MTEQDVIYEYAMAEIRAEGLGLDLAATRSDFVLRDARSQQEYARCSTLAEVNVVLDRRATERRQD